MVQNKKGLLQWTKDGFGLGVARELPGYPRYSMTGEEARGNWSLEISPVRSSDDGVYQCQVSASGEDPAIRSGEARLSVMSPPGPPHILQGEQLEISEGEQTELVCVSEGARPAGEVRLSWVSCLPPLSLTSQIFQKERKFFSLIYS